MALCFLDFLGCFSSHFFFARPTASSLPRCLPLPRGSWTFASLSGPHPCSFSGTLSPCAFLLVTLIAPTLTPAGSWRRPLASGKECLAWGQLLSPFLLHSSLPPFLSVDFFISLPISPACLGFSILCPFSRSYPCNKAGKWNLTIHILERRTQRTGEFR